MTRFCVFQVKGVHCNCIHWGHRGHHPPKVWHGDFWPLSGRVGPNELRQRQDRFTAGFQTLNLLVSQRETESFPWTCGNKSTHCPFSRLLHGAAVCFYMVPLSISSPCQGKSHSWHSFCYKSLFLPLAVTGTNVWKSWSVSNKQQAAQLGENRRVNSKYGFAPAPIS